MAKLKINRQVLAQFLPDPDSLRQFENLINQVNNLEIINAVDVVSETTNFDGHLSSSDTDIQKALETLDELKTFKDGIELSGFAQYSTQVVSSTSTVNAGIVFCDGSNYTVSMPDGVLGRKVEIFNRSHSGYVVISGLHGTDFNLFGGESIDCTYDGSNWLA